MEVNFHVINLNVVCGFLAKKTAKQAKFASDEAAFEDASSLITALQNTPVSRNDVIRRAIELVGSGEYPAPETMRMISHLLAIKMNLEVEKS
jgi:hypothetical protein